MTALTPPTETPLRSLIFQRFLPPDPSGAGRQAVRLARALSGYGVSCSFLGERLKPAHGDVQGSVEGFPTEWIDPLPDHPSHQAILTYWAHLSRRLWSLRETFDVLHVHAGGFEGAIATPFAGALLGKATLVRSSIEGEFAGIRRSPSGSVHGRMLSCADAFIGLSRKTVAEQAESGLPRSRIHLIPNGVNTSVFHPVDAGTKRALRRELGLPESGPIVVYHGVFLYRKAVVWLIRALGPVLRETGAHLLLVGGGARDDHLTDYEQRVQKVAKTSLASEQIHLVGFNEDVHRYLQAADAYVLPSVGEGLPNALLEAMAVGLAPVASSTSGSEDVIDHGENGLLFKPRDQDGLLDCVLPLLRPGGQDTLQGLGRRAARTIADHYSIDAIAASYARLYRQIHHARHGRGGSRASLRPSPAGVGI
jgi:glycosyltransferase involved in cell wall biosynthesis